MRISKITALLGICVALAGCATNGKKPLEWNAGMMMPADPHISADQVKARCVELFKTKVKYVGHLDGDPETLYYNFQTAGEMTTSIQKSPICRVTYAWTTSNNPTGGWDIKIFFDGKSLFYMGEDRSLGFVLTPNEDGSVLKDYARFRPGTGGVRTATGTLRKQ